MKKDVYCNTISNSLLAADYSSSQSLKDFQYVRGYCSVATGFHRKRKDVKVCTHANPQYSSFAEGARKYNSTGDKKCEEVGCPIDDEINDVAKHLRERIPELFLFDKEGEYKGSTQVRRDPLTNYYPLEHPDISVQLLPSCGDPGYEEGGYNDAIGIQEKNCETNTLLQTPISPSNDNNMSCSLPTENKHSADEKEGNCKKRKAGSSTFGVMDTVEVPECSQMRKALNKLESSQSYMSVVGCERDETVDTAFDNRIKSDNIGLRSSNIGNSEVTTPPISKAEHSVDVRALDALLEKQMKNCDETQKAPRPGRPRARLRIVAPENIVDDMEQNNVTTAVNLNSNGGETLSMPVIPPNFSLSSSNCGPVLEANESSVVSSYYTQDDELRERQVVQHLKNKQQRSSCSTPASDHMGVAHMDDKDIAKIIAVSTRNVMKGLLADGNSTVLPSAPLFPPSKDLMDISQVSYASNVRTGHPIEMAGVWQIDSLLLMRENGSVVTGLAKTCLTERDPQDSLVLRIDGQVFGGPVIAPHAVVRWSDPNGCRCCGGRWVVYKNENGITRLRVILFGNSEKTSGLAVDGTVLMMREWDHLESRYVVMPHVVGRVSEVEERESIQNVQGTAMAQRKLGECSLCKISTGGLDQLSLAVPEPKSILT